MEWVGRGSAAVRNGASGPPGVTAGSAVAPAASINERSAGVLNRTQYPSDVIALVVLWRLRYKLALRDLLKCS
jgi:CTP-dependent riboflavin kinase